MLFLICLFGLIICVNGKLYIDFFVLNSTGLSMQIQVVHKAKASRNRSFHSSPWGCLRVCLLE